MTWVTTTPEQKLDLVRDAVQRDGLSYGQAAARLGAPGRGSVAGVIERSKRTGRPIITSAPSVLAQQRKSAADARQKKAPREKPVKKPHQGLTNLVPLGVSELPDAEPISIGAWTPLEGSMPVPLHELREHQCKWSVSIDRPFLFCGLPTDGTGSWCAVHHKRAFRELPAKPKKPKA